MAITADYGYTNDSFGENTPLVKLSTVSNYSLRVDEPNEVSISNTTSPIDQPELITYQYDQIKKIPTKNKLANPLPDPSGVMYGVRDDLVLRVSSSTDDTYQVDLPVVVNISVKHPVHSAINAGNVWEALKRTFSALTKDDGSPRVEELMRSALKPVKN